MPKILYGIFDYPNPGRVDFKLLAQSGLWKRSDVPIAEGATLKEKKLKYTGSES